MVNIDTPGTMTALTSLLGGFINAFGVIGVPPGIIIDTQPGNNENTLSNTGGYIRIS